jgi:DNA-binding MarR family transcriptional regulator
MSKHPKTAIHWAFAQQGLSHFEKLLLVSIAFADENINSKATMGTVSSLSSMSRSAVKKKITKLKDLGLIKEVPNPPYLKSYHLVGYEK